MPLIVLHNLKADLNSLCLPLGTCLCIIHISQYMQQCPKWHKSNHASTHSSGIPIAKAGNGWNFLGHCFPFWWLHHQHVKVSIEMQQEYKTTCCMCKMYSSMLVYYNVRLRCVDAFCMNTKFAMGLWMTVVSRIWYSRDSDFIFSLQLFSVFEFWTDILGFRTSGGLNNALIITIILVRIFPLNTFLCHEYSMNL